jgi:uncharacterized protein YbcI
MDRSQRTIGQRIAQAARDFEQLRTGSGREWVAVFLNEATIVIALHGSLTDAERALVGNPAGRAKVLEQQQQLFAGAVLFRKIRSISGMVVLNSTVEIGPTTTGLVLLFTTDTAGMDFPLSPGRPARARMPGRGPLEWPEGGIRRTKTAGCLIRV